MSAANENATAAQTLIQASAAISNAVKVAKAADERVARAPKAASAAEIDKAAALLVQYGFTTEDRVPAIKAAFADPELVVIALQNVVLKAAESLGGDPRLNVGRVIDRDEGRRKPIEKKAAENDVSDADQMYLDRVAAYPRINRA